MFIVKLFPIIIVFISCVKSSHVSENVKPQSGKPIERNNDQDRPSSAELLSVPVAVIFEEGNQKVSTIVSSDVSVHQSESEMTTKSNEKTKDNSLTIFDKPQKQSVEVDFDNTKDGSVNLTEPSSSKVTTDSAVKNTKTNTKSTYNTEMEIQIPVAVIYDPVPENLTSQSRDKTRSSRRRQSKKRGNKNDNDLNNINPRATQGNQTKEEPMRTLAKKVRERDPVVPIIESENYVFSHNGDFHYSYEGGDGTKAFEKGELKSINENIGESVVGGFSYVGKDGNEYSLSYTADENGYRPVGAHLPTPPPIPPAIARALKYLATKTTPEPVTEAVK
ncbi:unnamed protein product [Chilo suppressalis]|uniref:Endocuticle structural glycoprotein SgAbd-3 n=1 Tax=Chilo suppressalis TaxID=168631 RepID=A0ABN8BGT6_CHISP|nr:unnamed protein product [Chilo suppressalis]